LSNHILRLLIIKITRLRQPDDTLFGHFADGVAATFLANVGRPYNAAHTLRSRNPEDIWLYRNVGEIIVLGRMAPIFGIFDIEATHSAKTVKLIRGQILINKLKNNCTIAPY
jgi:hypothetical protein